MINNKRKVFIVGGDLGVMRLFLHQGGFEGAITLDEADIVVFTGGADVHPSMYGEEPDPTIRCYYDLGRDHREKAIFDLAKDKFKVGICRGGQFLNVMNGGKLWYDVDNHTTTHLAYEPNEDGSLNIPFPVTSTHHQMFIKGPTAHVFLVAYMASSKVNANEQWDFNPARGRGTRVDRETNKWYPICDEDDLEGLYYAETGSMCFQPHPEYDIPTTRMRKFFFEKMDYFYQQFYEQKAKVA